MFITNIPTPTHTHCAHPHTWNPKPDKVEMRKLIELERMFEKWDREPLEPNYGAYKPTAVPIGQGGSNTTIQRLTTGHHHLLLTLEVAT
jgi:hypothetical protein